MATEKKILGVDGAQQMVTEVCNLMDNHNTNKAAHDDIRSDITNITTKLDNIKPWLVGSTDDITPAQVAAALKDEQNVLLTHTDATFGVCTFTNFVLSEGYSVTCPTIVVADGWLIGDLVGLISTSSWSVGWTQVAQASDIPTTLPNPNALTFSGAVSGTYDGSSAKTINIPTIAGEPGYTPVKGVDYWTTDDQEYIINQVLAILDASTTVHVAVDEENNITLYGAPDGTYTLKYENEDGSTTDICTLTISDGTGTGSGGSSGGSDDSGDSGSGDDSGGTDDPIVTTGNLFVADTCTLNKRIDSSGVLVDQDQTFVTDYINIGDCMADGGTNQIHFRGFFMYYHSMADGEINIGGFYRAVNYYDDNNTFLGQTGYYVDDFVGDENGDGLITLDASMTTATKIRVCGAIASADLTSTDQLADCIVTLNELIADSDETGGDSGGDDSGETEEPVVTYTNLVPTSLTPTDLTTVFNSTGYMDGAYASSSSPYYGSDSATVCTGVIPVTDNYVFYIKGITLDASVNSHCRVGIGQAHATNGGANFAAVKGVNEMSDFATLETLGDQYYKLTISDTYITANTTRQPYFFLSGIGTGANLIVTANEPLA